MLRVGCHSELLAEKCLDRIGNGIQSAVSVGLDRILLPVLEECHCRLNAVLLDVVDFLVLQGLGDVHIGALEDLMYLIRKKLLVCMVGNAFDDVAELLTHLLGQVKTELRF